jgi:uncharacterized RDD family membrane protein YckC
VNVQDAIDLNAVVTTPENIRFEYRLAGPFRRLPALVLDFGMRIAVFLAVLFFITLVGITGRGLGAGLLFLSVMIAWFALDWFYGLFFETYWNGQTPGKWLTKIRVISVDGRPINAYQATVRNFLRLADFAPMVSLEMFWADAPPVYMIPTFLVSLVCMILTTRFQRLGDLAAGTMVVVNEHSWIPPNIKLEDPRVASLSEHIPANFQMNATLAKAIALYAERRSRIPVIRRLELAAHLAKPLLVRFGFRDDTSPDLLLCALYYREFVSKDAFTDEKRLSLPPPIVSNSPALSRNGLPLESPAEWKPIPDSASLPPILNANPPDMDVVSVSAVKASI